MQMTTDPRLSRTVIRYLGGKTTMAPLVINAIPDDHELYVEMCVGGGAVFWNKMPSPLEIINDVDTQIVGFMRALRDHPKELIYKIKMTPFSREEHKVVDDPPTGDLVEDARRFYLRVWQSYTPATGRRKPSWGVRKKLPHSGWGNLAPLRYAAERLGRRGVQIENLHLLEMMDRYDLPNAVWYIDPPYVPEARRDLHSGTYACEMTYAEHVAMCERLQSTKARVIVSGYDNDLYREAFKSWRKQKKTISVMARTEDGAVMAEETLWMSWDAPKPVLVPQVRKPVQLGLFDAGLVATTGHGAVMP